MRLVIVGGGPRGVSVVERLIARARRAEAHPPRDSERSLDIDIIDPYPVGGGQVWRDDQNPWFINNTSALRNTLFVDEELPITGPIVTGPSVAEWAEHVAPRLPLASDPWFRTELDDFHPWSKPSRRLQGAYFRWVFDQAVSEAPSWVHVTEHRAVVIDVQGESDGVQRVFFRGSRDEPPESLAADLVVTAQGFLPNHVSTVPENHDFPPVLAADLPLDRLPAGDTAIVSGLGATFYDLLGALYEGRGGHFVRDGDGSLRYVPSGREPRIFAGSRTGLPHRTQRLNGPDQYSSPRIPLLERSHADRIIDEHRGRHDLTLVDDLWPEFLRQAGHVFTERAHALGIDERFQWTHLVDPTDGRTFADPAQWDALVDEHFRHEFLSLSAPDTSPWTAVHQLVGALRSFTERGRNAGIFTEEAEDTAIRHQLLPAANILASGPPSFRFERLAALRRQGFVRLIGPEVHVTPHGHGFEAHSPRVHASTVFARHWIAGYQSWGDLLHTDDPLVRSWILRGEARPDVLATTQHEKNPRSLATDPHHHPIGADGQVYRRRIILGCPAGQRQPGAGQAAIPHSGGSFLRDTDAAAELAWKIHTTVSEFDQAANAGIASSSSRV